VPWVSSTVGVHGTVRQVVSVAAPNSAIDKARTRDNEMARRQPVLGPAGVLRAADR
jgi:hypothetical protein